MHWWLSMKKVKLKDIANIYNGNSINARAKAEKYCFNVPAWNYIGTKDIDFDGTVNYDTGVKIPFEEKGFKIAPANCVFVCSEGGSAGKKTAHITQEVCFGNKLYAIVNNKNLFVSKYVYYYTRYREFFEQFKALMSGIIGGVSSKKFGEIEIPLLSLQKQQRIVEKIEELFSKLDKGVEELNKIKEQLKIYRQAVLKEAFSGKLTKSKKIERDVYSLYQSIKERNNKKFQSEEIQLYELPSGWMWIDITDGVEYGSSKKSQKSGSVPVLRMGNIQNGIFEWSDLAYSSDEDEICKYLLRNNDVLFNRTNSPELVGKTAIYRDEQKAIFAGYLIRINQYDVINAKYLNYYLNSFTAKMYGNMVKTDGVNQSNINGKKLCSYPFPLCTPEEQELVVKEIESRLSVCDKIEQTVNESLQKAESLRQSILKQAFEGGL